MQSSANFDRLREIVSNKKICMKLPARQSIFSFSSFPSKWLLLQEFFIGTNLFPLKFSKRKLLYIITLMQIDYEKMLVMEGLLELLQDR